MKRFVLLSFLFLSVPLFSQSTIDFETLGQDFNFTVFSTGGDSADYSVVDNPSMTGDNTSAKVGKLVIHPNGDPWGGAWTDDVPNFTLDANNSTVYVMVYKDVISDFNLKFEGFPGQHDNNVPNTVINQWEELVFDYSADIGQTVTRLTIIPDFQLPTRLSGSVNYFDNIRFGGDPVPVELTSFLGKAIGSEVHLSWYTATETNNRGFEVQRGLDEENFETIGFVAGSGTSTKTNIYNYVDKSPVQQSYYRLKQVDFDGTFEYSNVVEISLQPTEYSLSQNYPNPFNPSTKIAFTLPQENKVSIKLFNILGNEVAVIANDLYSAGSHEVVFNASNLSSGVYYYTLSSGNFTETRKLVLMK